MQPTRPADERPNLLRPLRLKPVQRDVSFAVPKEADDEIEAAEASQAEILERPLVYVRVRPDTDAAGTSGSGIKVDGANVTYPVPKKDRSNTISVEHVFQESATQEEVFQKVVREQVMNYILQGFRACIFAFGITGSGKSYTILGGNEPKAPESEGLLQRTIHDLFSQNLDNFTISMQAIQLHRHRFEDLGRPKKELVKVNSTIHVDKTDCSEHKFDQSAPALAWLEAAVGRRNVKATGGNKVSSRSHLVIRLHLHFTVNGEGRNAVLDVVDLAGSERIGSDVDEETSKDHIAIQAGLSCLQNCIESKIHNVKLPQHQQRLVPFTHFPLTKLLAPDFTGDAIVTMILTFSSKLDRAAEVTETLHFTSRMLGFRIAAKKQGVTLNALQNFQDLMKAKVPEPEASELPMTKAVSIKAQKVRSLEKQQNEELLEEVRRLRLQLEQMEREVISPLGALASELKEVALASEKQPASADLIARARKTMQDMQEKYPEDVKMIWPTWSEDLQPGKIKDDLKDFSPYFWKLEQRVVQHEKDICSLMERRASLQRMAKAGDGDLHQRQLEVLDALLAEATEGRPSLREFLSSWEKQWHDLLEKRQELHDLEAAAASANQMTASSWHMPLAENLDEDWAQWSDGGISEIEQLIKQLPASSQRIIHLHQARPESQKPLHEKGVRIMLETMEKTKKRYWHEELANCLGHTLNPEMLMESERADFCRRLAQQAVERIKGSDRLSTGDLESNFALNDASRESSIQIYMDFMKTVAKHPEAQALLASDEVVGAILAFMKHPSQPVAVAAFGALGQISPDTALIGTEHLIFILKIIMANQESASLRKAAAYCLQCLCSGKGAKRLRPMMEELDVVPRMLQVSHDETAKEDEAAILKHAKNVASLLLDGLNTAQVAKGSSYKQAVLEAIGCAAISKVSEGRLGGVAAGMNYWGQVQRGAFTASSSAMVTAGGGPECSTFWMNPMFLIRFTGEQSGKSAAMALTLSSLEAAAETDAKLKASAFLCFRLYDLSTLSKEASERSLNDEIMKQGQNLPIRSSKQALGPKVCYEQETSFYVNEVDSKEDHLLVVYTLDPLQEKKFAMSVFADSALEVTPLSRDGWQLRTFLGQWRHDAPAQCYGNPFDMFWHNFPQLMITNPSTSQVCICCILSYQAQDERKNSKSKSNELKDTYPFLQMQLFDASAQPLHRHVGFGKPKVETMVLCRDWVVLKAQLPPESAHSLVLGRSWFQNDGSATPETPSYAQDFRLQLLADYSDLDLQPISAGFEWNRFSAAPVLVRDHRPWHMKLQLKTACVQKQHMHLLLRIPEQVKAFMRLKVLKDGQELSPVVSQGKGDAFLPLIHHEYKLDGTLEFDMTVEFHPQSETGSFPLLVQGLSRSCDGELHFLAGDDRKDVGLEMMKDQAMKKWLEEVSAEPFSKRNPQTSNDLLLEPQAFPACSLAVEENAEQITVSKAYLQRLFSLAKAQEMKP